MKLYFIVNRRRNSAGELANGTYRGVSGWFNGINGPLVKEEADRLASILPVDVIDVELTDFEDLIYKAFEKAGVEHPGLQKKKEDEALDLFGEELEELDEDVAEEPDEAPESVLECADEDCTDEAPCENCEPVEEAEDADAEEDAEDAPEVPEEYPGYHAARRIMTEKGFDYTEGVDKVDGEAVEAAWERFVASL